MAFPKKRKALVFTEQERGDLESIRRSGTDEKRRTVRAAVLLDSVSGRSDEAIARAHRISRATVVHCIEKCLQFGVEAALKEAWMKNCACQKPKDSGYSNELWTYKLLTAHIRQHCVAAGYPAMQTLSRSRLHKILREGELRPHKIRCYVERRDPAFRAKMANVLCVYKEVEIINDGLLRGDIAGGDPARSGMVTISYDEKPGIRALGDGFLAGRARFAQRAGDRDHK